MATPMEPLFLWVVKTVSAPKMIVHLPIGLFSEEGSSGPQVADVVWGVNVQNVLVTGNSVEKNAGEWGDNAGASSTLAIQGDGYLQWSIGATLTRRFIGLALSDDGYNYDDAEVTWRFTSAGNNNCQLNGSTVHSASNYTGSESYKIERVGDDFFWYRDTGSGFVLEHTELGTGITGPLYADCSLASLSPVSDCLNATLSGVLA